jgi:RNA polymerase sigma-70 factor, ECF subfamily
MTLNSHLDSDHSAPHHAVSMAAARAAIEAVVRDSYSRLVAWLSVREGDIQSAEDALSGALVAALEHWPDEGIPDQPVAWLLTVSRRKLWDTRRDSQRRDRLIRELTHMSETDTPAPTFEEIPDERLRLMFACAHEAIDPAIHSALMLQTVLGLDAATVSRAYLVSPATLSARLVRAKARLRQVNASFELPGRDRLRERLSAVLDAIYTAFGTGWDAGPGTEHRHRGLAAEALILARIVTRLLPEEPEARGLLALTLFASARTRARRSPAGVFVSLDEQDCRLWDETQLAEAEAELIAAFKAGEIGRFQLEAAIQSAHVHRRHTGRTEWFEIARLYEALVQVCPLVGPQVGRAAALGEALDPARGLAALDAIPADLVRGYQPWWATRAHLLARSGDRVRAAAAYEQAIGLAEDPAVKDYLERRRQWLSRDTSD